MVELIVISHHPKIAQGLKEFIAELAPGVTVHTVAGLDDSCLGTSLDALQSVLARLESGAILFTDVGSSVLNANVALELYDGPHRIDHFDGPLVEGALSASALVAQGKTQSEVMDELNTGNVLR